AAPAGGCLELDDGSEATIVAGARMRLIDIKTVRVEPGTAVIPKRPSDGSVPTNAQGACPATLKPPVPADGQPASTANLVIPPGAIVELARAWPVRVDASGARACMHPLS